MLSPNFQVANFQVEEHNNQPVSISYKFKGTDKVVTKELFKFGSSFPSTKSITFDNKLGNLDLMVHYSDGAELMEGLPNQIAQYNISEGKKEEKTEKCSFIMRVSNNIHNVACLDEVEFVQEWTEFEKIPIKASPITVTPPPKKEEEKPPSEEKKEEGGEEKKAEAGPEVPPEVPKEEPPKAEEPKAEIIQPEQQYETKERKKKTFTNLHFSS